MDTTETYIKMYDCPEIQDGHTIGYGDAIALLLPNGEYGCGIYERSMMLPPNFYGKPRVVIWLPRQDDLQEMLYDSVGSRGFILVTYFVDQMRKGVLDNSQMDLTSMGQLWLAFVMKEKHNKVWDGEKWQLVTTLQLEKAAAVVQVAASVLRYRCYVDGKIAANMVGSWKYPNSEAAR